MHDELEGGGKVEPTTGGEGTSSDGRAPETPESLPASLEGSYRALFDAAADPIFIVDQETTRFLDCNRTAIERYGYTRDELGGMTVFQLHPHGEWDAVKRNVDEKGDSSPHTYTHVTKYGRRLLVEVHTELFEYQGHPAWISVVRDITDRTRTNEALGESQERYRNLVELSPEAIFVLHDGVIVFINDAGARLLGGDSSQDLIGLSVYDVVHPAYVEMARDRVARAIEEGRVPVTRGKFLRRDGGIVDVEVAGARITFQGEAAVQVVARDISERLRAEERLHIEKAYFETMFESAPQAIVLVDNSGMILRPNQEFLRMFGYRFDETIGQPVDDLIVPDELRDEAWSLTEAVAWGGTRSLESRRQRKDGSLVDVSILGAPIETEKGQLAVYGIYTDITERVRLEQRLRQSHKLEAIGQLAGGVAHDFNNLLTAIIGNCEIMLDDLDPRDPMYTDVEEVKRAGDRAASLTRQLLAFSRRQYLQPKVLDLNVVVADTEKMLGRLIGEDIELNTDLDSDLMRVKADPGQLEQVIVNLAVNARDAMPSGGVLTIETSNVDLDWEYARTHHPLVPGRYVMLSVSDTGSGMDAETQSRIFEPFFTTKEKGKGTGLGLATVYGIIKQSGGYIWAESKQESGTAFRIHLPPIHESADQHEPAPIARTAAGGSETIILVEDEDVVRALLHRVLAKLGYNVLHARQADEALEIAAGYSGNIDLLVTDVVMPGMNGRELSRELARSRPEIGVLYISGYLDTLGRSGGLGLNAAFLQKPFTPDALARKVREVLDSA